MRMSLTIDGVQARGLVALRNPTLWPVWFAMDGEGLAFLLGDPAALTNVDAPGPQPATQPLRWDRTLRTNLLPDETSGIGVALLYTEGGSGMAEVQSRYEQLTAQVHQLVIRSLGNAGGLTPLLAALGMHAESATVSLESLRRGVGAESLAAAAPDTESDAGDGFRVAAALIGTLVSRPLTGTEASSPTTYVPSVVRPLVARLPEHVRSLAGLTTRTDAAPQAGDSGTRGRALDVLLDVPPDLSRDRPVDPSRPPRELPPLDPPRIPVPLPPRATRVPEGTVVASLVQLWPAMAVKVGEPVAFSRPLAATTLPRASFQLSGSIRREN